MEKKRSNHQGERPSEWKDSQGDVSSKSNQVKQQFGPSQGEVAIEAGIVRGTYQPRGPNQRELDLNQER